MQVMGIQRSNTTTSKLQANGPAERYNKPITVQLGSYVSEQQDDWDLFFIQLIIVIITNFTAIQAQTRSTS